MGSKKEKVVSGKELILNLQSLQNPNYENIPVIVNLSFSIGLLQAQATSCILGLIAKVVPTSFLY